MDTVIDLTKTLHQGIDIVVESIRDNYEDPHYYIEKWANIDDKGYSVHALHLGTHTGTHIDAPSHFFKNTDSIDNIKMDDLVGGAIIMNFTGSGEILRGMVLPYKAKVENSGSILVIISNEDEFLSLEASKEIISWNPKCVVVACGFNEPDELYTKSIIFLHAGIPLVQNINKERINEVNDNDLIVAAPLKLKGMDGAPARVFAIKKTYFGSI